MNDTEVLQVTEESTANISKFTFNVCAETNTQGDIPFVTSINELGQIVITPVNTEDEFTKIIITQDEPCASSCMSIKLESSMMVAESITSVEATIDNIGQIIITPVSINNTFVSVENSSAELVEEEQTPSEDAAPENVTAEIVVEAVTDGNIKPVQMKDKEIEQLITELTNNYQIPEGTLICDTREELRDCLRLLTPHYKRLQRRTRGDRFIITYSQPTPLEEDWNTENESILRRFLMGDIALFSDDGKPHKSYMYIPELSTEKYDYYYDDETDAIVSYFKGN